MVASADVFPAIKLIREKDGLFSLSFHPENSNYVVHRHDEKISQDFHYIDNHGVQQNFSFTSIPGLFFITGGHFPNERDVPLENIREYPYITFAEDDLGVYKILFDKTKVNVAVYDLPGQILGVLRIKNSDGLEEHYRFLGYKGYFLLQEKYIPVDGATPIPENEEVIAEKEKHFKLVAEVKRQRSLYDAKFSEYEKLHPTTEVTDTISIKKRDVPLLPGQGVPAIEIHQPFYSFKSEEIPVQVTDAPDVELAKREHFSTHERFLKYLRGEEPVLLPASLLENIPTQVPDSPEVRAAKEQHFEVHRLAKSALKL